MPFSLLLAIFIAFGFEVRADPGPASTAELLTRCLETGGGVVALGLAACAFGRLMNWSVRRAGRPRPRLRRRFALGSRMIEAATLAVFAWIIHVVGWPGAVATGFGLRDMILVDEFLVLLPYLAALFLEWWGLYVAERALRADPLHPSRSRYLVLRARQALGLVLPVALIFSVGQDVLRRLWPQWAEVAWVEMAWMSAMAGLVLVLAPAFVRLTWPTRPLPAGPLRDRLERLSRRFGFRCTDILVWDTGHTQVNAGVTGALPFFRYVLLTDALVDNLEMHRVEAVFGHEIGHVIHRHMVFFGFFFLGSVVVMAILYEKLATLLSVSSASLGLWSMGENVAADTIVQLASMLLTLGVYFLLVFGFLSRRFERQADVFGCRTVSCGAPECPPHADLNGMEGSFTSHPSLCPVGIRIFADALSKVAELNGIERESWWAWRHGSIARRIAFLQTLEGRPEAERRFQRRVRWLRWALASALSGAIALAAWTGVLSGLR